MMYASARSQPIIYVELWHLWIAHFHNATWPRFKYKCMPSHVQYIKFYICILRVYWKTPIMGTGEKRRTRRLARVFCQKLLQTLQTLHTIIVADPAEFATIEQLNTAYMFTQYYLLFTCHYMLMSAIYRLCRAHPVLVNPPNVLLSVVGKMMKLLVRNCSQWCKYLL